MRKRKKKKAIARKENQINEGLAEIPRKQEDLD